MAPTPRRSKHAGKSEGELLRFVEDLKRQWMSTIDALVDPLMIVGKDYKIRKANMAMARMGGLDVKQVVGKKCHEVFAGRATPCSGCLMTKGGDSTEATTFDLEHVRGDRFYEVASQPLFDSDGHLDGIVQVYRDRTEAKKMQEQLNQQDKLASIGLLAGGVAHEINNPLGGILIFSQMLLRELPKDHPNYADVVEIEAATQRCKAIVESLLDFARQNPGGSKADRFEEFNILEAIRTATRFGRVSIQKGGIVDIKEEIGDEAHVLTADRNRMIQLFLNLIQNAIQAMPDGGTLVLRARTRYDDAKGAAFGIYEVEDTGVGIPPEHLKRIFDPFFTTKDPGEGTGLGLALCYGIVQDMAGKMDVESTVNVGTRFTIELPLGRVDVATRPAS
jgi:two-component system NtrC family sensor kinase